MDAMLEYEAMKREMNERVKDYYVKQNKQRQWVVDATTVIEQEVVVWAYTKEEAIEQARKDIAKGNNNVYDDNKKINILDIIEVKSNADKVA
jgi:hypothetical protein